MIEIIRVAPRKVVGIKVSARAENLCDELHRSWLILRERAHEIPHRVNDHFIDLSLGQKNGNQVRFIGAEVTEVCQPPEGMTDLQVPHQTYLHSRHDGPVEEIAHSFGAIYQWARTNGVVVEEFKIDEGYTLDAREAHHELYVRVIPRIPVAVVGV